MSISNKKILIIGGTGALGKELTKKYQDDNQIVIFSRDEHKHVSISKESWINNDNVSFRIGDVKDKESLRNVIEAYKPQIVINTAALKHVPICESNPYESVNVNILGNQNVIDTVKWSNHRIETLMFISTDKACKPINVYGMGKAISERLYVEFANQQTDIKVCIVRYGNVLESTGSVIPLFKKILNEGKTVLPITDMRMTRFLLTLGRAIELIDWAYSNDTHGQIAVPKIESFSIKAIADSLLKWKGIENGELETIGIRPGEKLHEEMISDIEWTRTVDAGENYLITDTIISGELKSYNSFDSLMGDDKVYSFLEKSGVL
jgi:UDP-glucose 4-epimerase